MSKVVIGVFAGTAVLSACVFAIAAGRSGKVTLKGGSFIGGVNVGHMSPEKAERTLTAWWDKERARPISLVGAENHSIKRTVGQLGYSLDAEATVAQVPRADFFEFLNRDPKPVRYKPVLRSDPERIQALAAKLDAASPMPSPARVTFQSGRIVRTHEGTSRKVDPDALANDLSKSITGANSVNIPYVEAPKRVSDNALEGITEVVGQFTTRFSTGKASRCANIKLASSKLDGIVLMPGERVSFNDSVGRRTVKNGFKIAGVYKDGKHDFDVGGGICQVSSTLYNAALFANLKIVRRQNHSMPVPYVPLGRDATVDYGAIDLVIENNLPEPIALASEYHPGRLTFRVLGQKDESLSVKLESEDRESWATETKKVIDPALPAGATKVVEKGTSGSSIKTYRLVYRNGELEKREPLGRSYYRGGPRIIAVGAPKPKAEPSGPHATLASAQLD